MIITGTSDSYRDMIGRMNDRCGINQTNEPIHELGEPEVMDENHPFFEAFQLIRENSAKLYAETLANRPFQISPINSPYSSDGFAKSILLDEKSLNILNGYPDWKFAQNLLSGNEDLKRMSNGVDIPKEGFLDVGVKRYTNLYNQIANMDQDAHLKRMIISHLDQGFITYCEESFRNAGLSAEDAKSVSKEFTDAFRKTIVSGQSIEAGYLAGLKGLSESYPSLITRTNYSEYSMELFA